MTTTTTANKVTLNKMDKATYDSATKSSTELYVVTDDSYQYTTMPTASATFVDKIAQYVGTTDSTYTNGYFYKCSAQGTSPETYAWSQVNVQGGSSYSAGTGINISNNTISVKSNVLQNTASTVSYALTVAGSTTNQTGATNIGVNSRGSGQYGIALGYTAMVSRTGAIQLGKGENSTAGTMAVALTTDGSTWNNYELLSADGTIPSARLANAVTSTTGSLTSAGWSSSSQTINVTGVTASNTVWVSPAPSSASAYSTAGIVCTAQGAGTLTFTCTTTPTADITVNVAIAG